MLKLPENVDRETFWMWAVPLVLAHLAFSIAAAARVPGMAAGDIVVTIWYIVLLARRFRDIGWPGWIAVAFVVATMVVIPFGFLGYAIANELPMAEFATQFNRIGMFTGAANLVLLIMAGSMKGKAPAVAEPAVAAVHAPAEAGPSVAPSAAPVEPRKPDPFVVGAVTVFAVAVIGLIVALLLRPQQATQAVYSPSVSPPPAMTSSGNETESNGLTKNTNDFLRQFSQQPGASR